MRFLLIGACAAMLVGSSVGAAEAAAAVPVVAPATAEGPAVSSAAVEAARERLARLETAAPTAGADLAMWGAAPDATEDGDGPAPAAAPQRLAAPKAPARLASPVQRFASGLVARGSLIATGLTRSALRFLGVPYSFGGTSASGFDCSGFVQHVFAMMGVTLPRTADAQYVAAHRIRGGALKKGDLVFFQTYESGPSHVGIYLGSGRFVHASSSRGVTVSSLRESYWSARYLGAKRVVD